jgi:hypothetical protein
VSALETPLVADPKKELRPRLQIQIWTNLVATRRAGTTPPWETVEMMSAPIWLVTMRHFAAEQPFSLFLVVIPYVLAAVVADDDSLVESPVAAAVAVAGSGSLCAGYSSRKRKNLREDEYTVMWPVRRSSTPKSLLEIIT